jgi:hypothetical protein
LFRSAHGFVNGEPRTGWAYDLSDGQQRSVTALVSETGLFDDTATTAELSSGRYRCLELFASFMAENADMPVIKLLC